MFFLEKRDFLKDAEDQILLIAVHAESDHADGIDSNDHQHVDAEADPAL